MKIGLGIVLLATVAMLARAEGLSPGFATQVEDRADVESLLAELKSKEFYVEGVTYHFGIGIQYQNRDQAKAACAWLTEQGFRGMAGGDDFEGFCNIHAKLAHATVVELSAIRAAFVEMGSLFGGTKGQKWVVLRRMTPDEIVQRRRASSTQ